MGRKIYRQLPFTQVDNLFFDVVMRQVSANQFKVLCCILRHTIGWQKDKDFISYSRIMAETGIKSRATISKCLKGLLSSGHILRFPNGKYDKLGTPLYSYSINDEYEVSGTENEPRENASGSNFELHSGTENEPHSGSNIEHTKEINKHQTHGGVDLTQERFTETFNPKISNLLCEFGVNTDMAHKISENATEEQVKGWICYCAKHPELRNPQGFVVSRLKLGEFAPVEEPENVDFTNSDHAQEIAESWAGVAMS